MRSAIGGGPSLPTSIGGTPAVYRIEVPANVAARVRLQHRGIYVILLLRLLETGERLAVSDDSNGENGEELVAVPIRETDVTYEVSVRPVPREVCSTFELTLEHVPLDDKARWLAEAHRLNQKARIAEMVGDAKSFAAALELFDQAATLARRAGEPITEAEILYRSAIVYGQVSRTAEGIEQLNRVIPIYQELGFRGAEGRAINRRGELSRRVGDILSAERDLRAALPLVLEANDYEGICDVRNNLGLVYQQSGRWSEAIALYEEALPLTTRASLDVAATLEANLGLAFSNLGDYRRALAAQERSMAIRRSRKVPRLIANGLRGIALTQIAMGDLAKAKASLKEAAELAEVAGDPQVIGNVQFKIGQLHLRDHEIDDAERVLSRALEMLRKARDRRTEARVLVSLARVDVERGNPDAATELLAQALASARETFDRTNQSEILDLRARILQKAGHLDAALRNAQEAVAVLESIREAIVNPDLRSSYLGTVRRYYDLVIELLMLKHEREPQGGFAAEAFRAKERSRARTLLESLARSQANIVKGIPPELLRSERGISRQLDAKENYRVQLLRDSTAAQIAANDATIAELRTRHDAVKNEIRAVSPDYAALEFPEPVALADVQTRLLDSDTTLLAYHLGSDRSVLWVVSDRSVEVHVLPAESQIEGLVKAWHDALRQNPATIDATAATRLRRRTASAGEALARAVLHPAAAAVKSSKRLLVLPDGALHYVPFAALPDAQGKPLLHTREIAYLPSATLLDTLRRATRSDRAASRDREARSVAVFADPVFQRNDPRLTKRSTPGAFAAERSSDAEFASSERMAFGELRRLRFSRREAEAILETADRSKSLEALDFRATKQALLTADLRRYAILHIATHGMANAEEPDLSGLMFSRYDARGKRIDGFLGLQDVYNLDLQADLVVLSACRTALGKAVFGEGLISLTRGFMYSGARRVMATVWNVDDRAAARLMAEVYEAMLGRGASPARALRDAQLAMQRDPRWSDPYYWAGFTLHGDWQ
ncbi:MAG TPA: CHAT domain-containing protein [Thermoanaerobaculia bacterium]|nr:CHAT domain-containing protein [Thermoanaerobaculia bacterium]